MKREQFDQMLAKASKSVQQLNQELARVCPIANDPKSSEMLKLSEISKPKKRIRQSSNPLSNDLEIEFGRWLRKNYPGARCFHEQAITFRIANGVRYTPDWVVMLRRNVMCFEVKGKHAWDDSIVKIKVAAFNFPKWDWFMAWKSDLDWCIQRILP